jgi:predicted enzyme related to lactoylglutathione lyase
MSSSHGSFVWYELMTSDPKAAEAFYRRVIGWDGEKIALPHLSYTMFTSTEAPTGSTAQADATARPGWLGYVAVDDVDVGAARAIDTGGAVRRQPTDIPDAGRFAVISDPQGGTLALFKPLPDGRVTPMPLKSLGSVGWHELHAGDRVAALAFYSGLFGWTKGRSLDMGEMGIYQMFDHGAEAIGGMMTKPSTIPSPFWLFYFNVEAIQPAITRVGEAGGQILNGPHQVPGGSWIVQGLDPQGGLFALVEPAG